MKRCCATFAIAALATIGGWAAPAMSAPPTVTPSPGYDTRLKESRAARAVYAPSETVDRPAPKRRLKRVPTQ